MRYLSKQRRKNRLIFSSIVFILCYWNYLTKMMAKRFRSYSCVWIFFRTAVAKLNNESWKTIFRQPQCTKRKIRTICNLKHLKLQHLIHCAKELIEILSFITDNFPILFLNVRFVIFNSTTERLAIFSFWFFSIFTIQSYLYARIVLLCVGCIFSFHSIPFINENCLCEASHRIAPWTNRDW